MFYLLAYGLTTIGAFAVLTLVRDGDGEASHLSQWAGLASRSPLTAAIMSLFLLALAGIPLTAGFTAKFAVFRAAIEAGAWPLVVVALLASAVAAFFYLRVIVLMYFSPPARRRPDGRRARAADDDRPRDHRHGHPGAGHRARVGARPGRAGGYLRRLMTGARAAVDGTTSRGAARGLAPGLHPGVDHRPLAPRGSAGRRRSPTGSSASSRR